VSARRVRSAPWGARWYAYLIRICGGFSRKCFPAGRLGNRWGSNRPPARQSGDAAIPDRRISHQWAFVGLAVKGWSGDERQAPPASVNTKSPALADCMDRWDAGIRFRSDTRPHSGVLKDRSAGRGKRRGQADDRELAIYTGEESIRCRHSVAGAPISSRCALAAARCTSPLPNCRPASNAVSTFEIR